MRGVFCYGNCIGMTVNKANSCMTKKRETLRIVIETIHLHVILKVIDN